MSQENVKKNDMLTDFRRSITSQFGEDGVFEKIFEIIGVTSKWCVEFGAGNGLQNSNSWNLISNLGWNGVLIEGDKSEYAKLKNLYQNKKHIYIFQRFVEESGKNSLDNLLSQTKIPKEFDFLSIDIDGHDYHVWESLKNYSSRVVIIEFNRSIPLDLEFIQPKNSKVVSGSSILALKNLGLKKDYELIYAHAANAIFVKKGLFSRFGILDNSPAALLKGVLERKYFQLYDGSIVLVGGKPQGLIGKKKIRAYPVWLLRESGLYGMDFKREPRFYRVLKNFIKKTFFYSIAINARSLLLRLRNNLKK